MLAKTFVFSLSLYCKHPKSAQQLRTLEYPRTHMHTPPVLGKMSKRRKKRLTSKSKVVDVIGARIRAGTGEAVILVAVDVATGVWVLGLGLATEEALELEVGVCEGGVVVLLVWQSRCVGGFGGPALDVWQGGLGRCRARAKPVEGLAGGRREEEDVEDDAEHGPDTTGGGRRLGERESN